MYPLGSLPMVLRKMPCNFQRHDCILPERCDVSTRNTLSARDFTTTLRWERSHWVGHPSSTTHSRRRRDELALVMVRPGTPVPRDAGNVPAGTQRRAGDVIP